MSSRFWNGPVSRRAVGLRGVARTFPAMLVRPRLLHGRPKFSGTLIVPATVAWEDSDVVASAAATNDFVAMDLGAAAANRKVVVTVNHLYTSTGATSVSAITIHVPDVATDPTGTSLTLVKAHTGTGAFTCTGEIWQAALPNGTSGTVRVSVSRTGIRVGVNTLAVYGAKSAAHDTGNSDADPLNDTIACPSGGIVIGTAVANIGGGGSFGWTNLDEGSDQLITSETYHTAAARAFAAEQAALSVTCDPTAAAAEAAMALASWGPA